LIYQRNVLVGEQSLRFGSSSAKKDNKKSQVDKVEKGKATTALKIDEDKLDPTQYYENRKNMVNKFGSNGLE